MEIREISYYRQFQCYASACEQTCCRGWIIPLEEEDIGRFRKEKGLLRLKLLLATRLGTRHSFNASSATCPFQDEKKLCSLQLLKGHDFIPEAFREYPRFYRNYGLWEERMIDLSCIAGAKLWFDHHRDLSWNVSDGAPVCGKDSTNDDEDYLRALDRIRQEYIRLLLSVETAEDLIRTLCTIDSHAQSLQDFCLHAGTCKSVPRITEVRESTPGIFPFGASTFCNIMKTHLFGERLAVANPALYALCRLYFDMGATAFTRKWPDLAGDFLIRHERYASYYASLFAHYLGQHFLRCYEDYSFLRNIRMGLIHLNMKFFFDVLFKNAKGTFTDADFVRNIAVYNRRGYFNMQIQEEMYGVVSAALTGS